jgi:acyl-CoA dehydrogenase
MTAQTEDPVELSRTLGQRLDLAREPGDEKAFADAILAQLAKDRLLWVVAPNDKGGTPLSIGDTARITFNIARLSGSAGLIYAMHMSQALTIVRHGRGSAFFSDFVQRLAQDQALVASGTSEKGVDGDIFGSICTIEDGLDGVLVVTKESPIISYMDHAGAILVTAMRTQANGRKSQALVAVKTEDIEFQPGPAMSFLGMRGIVNRPFAFTARFREEAIFPETYPVIARATMTPSVHIFWAALWTRRNPLSPAIPRRMAPSQASCRPNSADLSTSTTP